MDSRREEFYKNLIIDEEDKERAERFLTSKGVEKHIILKEKLFNWIEGDKIEYSLIASTYRYDKRLRNILFKYISYLEEFYRSVILDEYRYRIKKIQWIRDIKERLEEFNGDLNDALEHIDFSSLLIQTRMLPQRVKNKCLLPKTRNLKENSIALKELRNAVMHNKFLLLYRGYETCYIDGVDDNKSSNLKANILNLISFLPEDVAEGCIRDINAAREEKENQLGTKWNLPPAAVIKL